MSKLPKFPSLEELEEYLEKSTAIKKENEYKEEPLIPVHIPYSDETRTAIRELEDAAQNALRDTTPLGDDTCLHDNCPKCRGTGIDSGGGACIHMISCNCPKCRIT
jgi:hypothetical protein